jgi:hypothetical protein
MLKDKRWGAAREMKIQADARSLASVLWSASEREPRHESRP